MVKKVILNGWLLSILFISTLIQGSIVIRKAYQGDLQALLHLDHEVTYEYFKPMYKKAYSHFCIGKDPDYYLGKELNEDKVWFKECISSNSEYILNIAVNTVSQEAAGLIVSHKEDDASLLIDLLLVRKKYRNRGVGKGLVRSIIKAFKDVHSCVVCPFGCKENQATLNFL